MTRQLELVWPALEYLPGYTDALRQGWSPDNLRPEACREALEEIERDPAAFLAAQVDRSASGPPIIMPDGSTVPRLPGFHLWIWDGEFCGDVGFRWQLGSNELPPTCLGHAGYSVVPWKQRRGYASRALALLLPLAAKEGLDYVELTTEVGNTASRRVMEKNGGVPFERFLKLAAHGGTEGIRYRIRLGDDDAPA